jgi:Uma2 family endonuclease
MNWQQICNNPAFNDLPFKFETNEWGKIEMSPASNTHSVYQSLIMKWFITSGQQGLPITECSVQTTKGVKVADVAWASVDFFKRNKLRNPYLESPEIMIEVISPSNTKAEMMQKKQLYFAKGAREVWLCGQQGKMSFFNAEHKLENSVLMADFPHVIEIDFF